MDKQFLELISNLYVLENQTIQQAIELLDNTHVNALPVISEEKKYIGVVTLKSLIYNRCIDQNQSILTYIKRYKPIRLKDDMLKKAAATIKKYHYDIVPVVKNNLYQGFLSKEDIYHFAYLHFMEKSNEYSQVIDSSYNGIVAINADGIIFVYNPAAERILGCNKEEMLGKHVSCLDPANGLLETLKSRKTSVGTKTTLNGFTILTNRTPLIYKGEYVGAVGVFQDVSDLEKASHELNIYRNLSQELNTILESSYDGLYICDQNGRVIRVNTAWEKICGIKREFALSKTAKELVDEGWYDKSAALMTIKTKKVFSTMLEIKSGPKKGQIIMATGTPIFDENGELIQVVVNVRDITDLENLKVQLLETMELSKRYESELEEIRLQLQKKSDDIVVRSPAMQRVMELAVRVSKVDSTVMITGESGVGKDVIAKKIHMLSNRRDNSLIKINCGAIPENLLESELFGYEGGAFTGAKKEGKPGMFELASGGTLFLDEIGDMPLGLQVKLLKVLQEKEMIRVGGTKTIKVDARIITATNRDLEEMVKEGTFRKDLFYRLNVVNIKIPPLRNRKEDMEHLLGFVLNNLNKRYQLNKYLSQPVIERLLQYDWPGNIRELENMLERLVILSDDQLIQLKHLPSFLLESEVVTDNITIKGIIPLKEAVEELESQLLREALKKYKTTRQVAKSLGVNQSTVVRKLHQYQISKDDAEEHELDAYGHLIKI